MSSFNWSFSTTPAPSTPAPATTPAPVGALFQVGTTSTSTDQPTTGKQLTWSTQFEDLPPVVQTDLTKIQYRTSAEDFISNRS